MTLNFLKKGDVVEVISPGTACTGDENDLIKKFLIKLGLKPRIFCEKQLTLAKSVNHEFPSFEPKQRFLQLKKAIEGDSKIIWCARGGYGSFELVEFLQKMPKPKKAKIFIGFSDISSLNKILIEKWGWQVVTAPMLAQIVLKKVSEKSIKAISDFIFGKISELKYELISLNAKAKISNQKSEITGGCLSVLAGSFGTKNQIDWQGKFLFLEDEGESGERLDRYFTQIISIINEQKKIPSAIILGNFLEANLHGNPKAKNIEFAIKKFAKNLGKIPLYQEKKKVFGHSKNMLPLIFGSSAEIDQNKNLLIPLASIFDKKIADFPARILRQQA